jgi:hypothetical protein
VTNYEANVPRVVWDRVDEEVIALDCIAGIYFRLNHAASDVWQALDDGATTEQLLAAGVDAADLETFITELATAQVLRECQRPEADVQIVIAGGALGLERFEDLKEILEADPIHEVDPDKGWPIGG